MLRQDDGAVRKGVLEGLPQDLQRSAHQHTNDRHQRPLELGVLVLPRHETAGRADPGLNLIAH